MRKNADHARSRRDDGVARRDHRRGQASDQSDAPIPGVMGEPVQPAPDVMGAPVPETDETLGDQNEADRL